MHVALFILFCAYFHSLLTSCLHHIVLCEQLCQGGLMQYSSQRDGAADAIQTVQGAVTEITSGVSTNLSVPQSIHWNFKLAALCTWRTLATYSQANLHDTVKFIVPENNTLHCLPDWNLAFFFDLVKANNWIQHFLQVFFCRHVLLFEKKIVIYTRSQLAGLFLHN
jgi:hypothetical protein